MGYRKAVEEKIAPDDESGRRIRLWKDLADAYERGGREAIKSALSKRLDGMAKEFNDLVRKLKEKL